jgi:glycosyltransferase involved in cell wall biosynthesis
VRPYQQLYYADRLREQVELLEELTATLAERGTPITELEAKLLREAGTARLLEVENALRYEACRRTMTPPRRAVARIRWYFHPRIGILHHYDPKPLTVPAAYFATRAPALPPTISIVTPSYEQGRFLERTIYSVLSQGYPALEYVVQDGGSSDETIEVIRRYERQLVRWASERDNGQADAINRGFAGSSGEIMAWLNSDDLLLPGALAYVARYFAEHPEVDVVYGHRVMIDERDGQIGAWIMPPHDDFALTVADYIPQETLFWRRSIWEASGGGLDTDFGYALDWDLLLRFRDAGARMVRLPRFLGAFRIHDEQKSTAAIELGTIECERLRERVHGRHVTVDEVLRRLQPYFKRHLLVHYRHRLLDRLPLQRVVVRTLPPESDAIAPAPQSEEREPGVLGVPTATVALAPTPATAAAASIVDADGDYGAATQRRDADVLL